MNLLDRYLNNVEVGLLLENLESLKSFIRDERSYIPNSDFETLLSLYPNKTQITIYRGLNFKTKEIYEKFLNDIKDGKLKTDKITSWSPDPKEAESFAKSKMVNDFSQFSLSDMDEIRDLRKEGIMGYRGVIVETTIPSGVGVDVDMTGVGQESEVLIPKGEYDVSIFKEVKKRSESLNKEVFNDIVEKSDKINEDIEYVLLQKPEWVDKEIFDILYGYTETTSIYEKTEYATFVEYWVGVILPKIVSYEDFNEFLDDKQKTDIIDKFKKSTSQFKNEFEETPDDIVKVVLETNKENFYQRGEFPVKINTPKQSIFKDVDPEFWGIVKEFYVGVYRKLNSIEVTKKIKSREQQDIYKRFIVEAIQRISDIGK